MLKSALWVGAAIVTLLGSGFTISVWKQGEFDRRYDSLRRLMTSHHGLAATDWQPEMVSALWQHITWFRLRSPSALTERIRKSIASGIESESEFAFMLAIHLHMYSVTGMGVFVPGGSLPVPPYLGEQGFEEFGLPAKLLEDRRSFSKLAEHRCRHVRQAFLTAVESLHEESAYLGQLRRIAECDQEVDLRVQAVHLLPLSTLDRSSEQLCRSLLSDQDSRVRFAATVALLAFEERGVLEAFVNFLRESEPLITIDHKLTGLVLVRLKFPHLADLCTETDLVIRESRAGHSGLNEDVWAKWQDVVSNWK
jgi:hypothetical protein